MSALRCSANTASPFCDISLVSLEALSSNATHLGVLLRFSADVLFPPGAAAAVPSLLSLRGGGWGRVVDASLPSPSTLALTAERAAGAGADADGPLLASLAMAVHAEPLGAPVPGAACSSGGSSPAPPVVQLLTLSPRAGAGGAQPAAGPAPAAAPPPRCEARALAPAAPAAGVPARLCAWRSPLRASDAASWGIDAAAAAWRASIACAEAAAGGAPAAACACTPLAEAEFSVVVCGGGAPPPLGGAGTRAPPPARAPPTPPRLPSYSLTGVAAVGARGLRLPHADVAGYGSVEGGWSLTAWLWLWEGGADPGAPRGPRTLLFKGHGGGDQGRSPSAWVEAGGGRLLLRVSTADNADTGGASIGELPARRWVHVAFVFRNASTPPPGAFEYQFFMGGALDTGMAVAGLVDANDGPLHVGRAGGQFEGSRALLSQLKLWARPLGVAEVAAEAAALAPFFASAEGAGGAGTGEDAGELLAAAGVGPAAALALHGVLAATRLAEAWGPWWAGPPARAPGVHFSARAAALAALNAPRAKAAACAAAGLASGPSGGAHDGAALHGGCPSAAEAQAWGWALGWLGVAGDGAGGFAWAGSEGDGAHPHPHYAPRYVPEYEEEGGLLRLGAAAAAAAAGAVLEGGNCSGGVREVARAAAAAREAAAWGAGPPAACALHARQLLLPGRGHCPEELRGNAWRWAVGGVEARRFSAPAPALALVDAAWRALAGGARTAAAWLASRARAVVALAWGGAPALALAPGAPPPVAARPRPRPVFSRDTAAARALFASAAMRGDAASLSSWGLSVMVGVGGGGAAAALPSPLDAAFGLGLLHLAAAAGDADAWASLARQYEAGEGGVGSWEGAAARGEGGGAPAALVSPASRAGALAAVGAVAVSGNAGAGGRAASDLNRLFSSPAFPPMPRDAELAAFYYHWAADAAEGAVQSRGGQVFLEYPRLTVDSADGGAVEAGQRGADDGALAALLERGEAGVDWEAAASAAGLLYWGARGFERDLPRARRLWEAAATRGGLPAAAVAAAAMFAKGEGGAEDVARAVELWRGAVAALPPDAPLAARALNGLGFAFFNGGAGVPANGTAAYEHFSRAAAAGDADGLFNAGRCLQLGVGVERSTEAAAALFERGAAAGGWASGLALGRLAAEGGLPGARGARDAAAAGARLAAAAAAGPWGGLGNTAFQR